ncbi:MAG: hypothetical protein AAB316_18840 [Bacteroidota bacterium]
MKKAAETPLLAAPAHLWDGIRQLPGSLELWEDRVVFRFSNFKDSHLNLTILLAQIELVEEYLVFDLARNGLRFQSKNGWCDLFVLEEGVHEFKKAVLAQVRKCLG